MSSLGKAAPLRPNAPCHDAQNFLDQCPRECEGDGTVARQPAHPRHGAGGKAAPATRPSWTSQDMSRSMWLPWGYIMGPEPDSTRRIPGLKIETWGTRPISSEDCLGRVVKPTNTDFCVQPNGQADESLQKSLQSCNFEGHRRPWRARKSKKIIGSSGRTRTYNPSVNSRMLCH
jgi:hypothetical protein